MSALSSTTSTRRDRVAGVSVSAGSAAQLRGRRKCHGKSHDEFAALPQSAMSLHPPVMHLYQPLHKRQPDTQAAL